MDLDNKWLKRSIEPYHREAWYCFFLDIIFAIVFVVIYFALDLKTFAPQLIYVIPIYFVAECLINYRISLLSVFERYFSKFGTDTLTIVSLYEESSASGWLWNSVVGRLYPKELNVSRYKIVCRKSDGTTLKLRSAMSGKKAQEIVDLFINKKGDDVQVGYTKFTKIIYNYSEAKKGRKNSKETFRITYLNCLF